MTDILVLNQAMALLVFNVCVVLIPCLMFAAFMVGRYSALKWYEKNAHLYAEDETRTALSKAREVIAEKDREIKRKEKVIQRKDERIGSITAAVRAAQVKAGGMNELLTLCVKETE